MEVEKTVSVFDGPLLAGGVGVGVVEVALDNGRDLGDVEGLACAPCIDRNRCFC